MDKTSLDEYYEFLKFPKGPPATTLKLTPKLAALLMKDTHKNAVELFLDANTLFEANRFERSTALSILAIEEIGKIDLILHILLWSKKGPKQLKEAWNKFRSHRFKNTKWLFPVLQEANATITDLDRFTDPNGYPALFLDKLKMAALYVDIDNNGVIYRPGELDHKFAEQNLDLVANLLLNSSGPYPEEYLIEYLNFYSDRDYVTNFDQIEFYSILHKKKIIPTEQFKKIVANINATRQ